MDTTMARDALIERYLPPKADVTEYGNHCRL